jgi:hypothetical protein
MKSLRGDKLRYRNKGAGGTGLQRRAEFKVESCSTNHSLKARIEEDESPSI